MKKLYLLTTIALVALTACDKEEMPAYLSDPDAVRIEAAVGTLTRSNPLGDVDEQRKFNEGDRISVTNAGKTVVYKLQNGTWAPENSSEYLKWDKSDLEFTAEYPAGYTTLPVNQSDKEKLASADRMWVNIPHTRIPDDRILSAELKRKNALVKVKIAKFLDQYTEGTYISSLRIRNGSNGVIPLARDEKGEYYEGENRSGTVGWTYSAILEPVTGDKSTDFIDMILLSGGQRGDNLIVKGVPELKAGHAYTFELYVGKESVKIGNVTVEEWTPGDNLPDGETDAIDTWDGQTTEAFATKDAAGKVLGDAEDSPILIRTAAQLAYLANKVYYGESYSGKFFKLTDDLNLDGHAWTPVGFNDSKPFSGIFDGDGHEIMGLRVETNYSYLGLFGYINGSKISNLKISSAVITYKNMYGAILCGVADNSQIDNCSVSGEVKIENNYAGGIVAELKNNSSMNNCTAEVKVNGSLYVGGLCGSLGAGNISGCTVLAGSIGVYNSSQYPCVGGLVGIVSSDGAKIENCSTYAKVSGLGYVGGAFGYVDADGDHEISGCNVCGDVSVMVVPDHITDAYQGIGGFIGYLSGGTSTFSGCGFNGTVGKANGESFTKGSIYGAFVGHDDSKATFENCWYNADKAGELDAIGDNNTKTGIEAKN